MDKKTIGILVFVLAIGVILVALYVNSFENWSKGFRTNQDDPFDISLLYETLERSGDLITLDDSIHFEEGGNASCFIFRRRIALDAEQTGKLIDFIKTGNNVHLTTYKLTGALAEELGLEPREVDSGEDQEPDQDLWIDEDDNWNPEIDSLENYFTFPQEPIKSIELFDATFRTSAGDELTVPSISNGYKMRDNWQYIDTNLIQSEFPYITTCRIDIEDRLEPSSIRFSIGEGHLDLVVNPEFYTNYHFKEADNYTFISSTLHTLGGDKIYWNNVPNSFDYYRSREADPSPLSVILSIDGYKYAWYLLLLTIVLFFLLGGKRKQKAIPFWKKKENSTLVYTQQIADLYKNNQHHYELANSLLKWYLFLLKERYKLHIKSAEIDRIESVERIASATGASQEEVSALNTEFAHCIKPGSAADQFERLQVQFNTFQTQYI